MNGYTNVAIIVILSFLLPIISAKLFKCLIPAVAIEIIAGLIIGKSGFGLIEEDRIVAFLSMFGLVYLMFLSGLEIDIKAIGSIKRKNFIYSPPVLAILTFLLTLLVAYPLSIVFINLFSCAKSPFYLALILSTSSVAVVYPLLKSRPDIKGVYKQTILICAIVADFSTLFLITLFALLKEGETGIVNFVVIFLLFVIAILASKIITIFSKHRWTTEIFSILKYRSTVQIGVRAAFALLFIFLFLAELFGIEAILGAFLAGAVVSELSKKEADIMRMKLDAFGYGFFIPLFFIYQGATLTVYPASLGKDLLLIMSILFGGFLIKLIAVSPLLIRFSFKETLSAGLLLSSRLSLIIAASIIGLNLGIIDESMHSAIIIFAVLSCIFSPSLFNILQKKKFVPHLVRIIIIGGGIVGNDVAKRFKKMQKEVIVIEKDRERCKELDEATVGKVYCGDVKNEALMKKISPQNDDVLLLLTNDDQTNLDIALMLKEKYNVHKIFARDNNPKNRNKFEEKNITPLIYTEQLLRSIEKAVSYPSVLGFLAEKENIIQEKTINKLDNKSIKESHLSEVMKIILIKRGEQWLYPHEKMILKKGDIVIFVADEEDEKALQRPDI